MRQELQRRPARPGGMSRRQSVQVVRGSYTSNVMGGFGQPHGEGILIRNRAIAGSHSADRGRRETTTPPVTTGEIRTGRTYRPARA